MSHISLMDSNVNYWIKLKEICDKCENIIEEGLNPEGDAPELQLDYIKERLMEVTRFIDTKIESIFKLAQEEESDFIAQSLTNEFLEQLIEVIEDLCWLILRIPEGSCSRHLVKKYENGYETILEIIRGIERIWRSIRSGFIGIPRNRDYTTSHIFRNIRTDPFEDARDQWIDWIEQLKETFDPSGKDVDSPFDHECVKVLKVTLNILKKIRLQFLSEHRNYEVSFYDDILNSGEEIVSTFKESARLLSIHPTSHFQLFKIISKLNEQVHDLMEIISDDFKYDEDDWFMKNVKEIDDACEIIDEMNPMR